MRYLIGAALLIVSAQLLGADEASAVDMFKVNEEGGRVVLFFKSSSDPEIVKSGGDLAVLFRDKSFVREKVHNDPLKNDAVRRLSVKNYEGKGGAVNVLGKQALDAVVIRMSEDVVRVELGRAVTLGAAPVEKKIKDVKAEALDMAVTGAFVKKEEPAAEKPTPVAPAKAEVAAAAETAAPQTDEAAEKVRLAAAKVEETAPALTVAAAAKESAAPLSAALMPEKQESSMTFKMVAVLFLLAVGTAGALLIRKRGKKDIFGKSGLLSIVESLSLGMKEKLVLLDVGGNYVLLFVKDKDVRELTVFAGDDAERIRKRIDGAEDVLEKEFFKAHEPRRAVRSEKAAAVKPFKSRFENMLAREKNERADESDDIESEVYSTINRLKSLNFGK